MTVKTKHAETKDIPQNRRIRRFGLNDSILSTTTAYLNYYNEDQDPTIEDVAMFATLTKCFNE